MYIASNTALRKLLAVVGLLLAQWSVMGTTSAVAQRQYTKEKPLLIGCQWDFPPYEFNANNGQPAGYDVDLLDLILNELDIPHEYTSMGKHKLFEAYDQGKVDLIVSPVPKKYKVGSYSSRHVISYYRVQAAARSAARPIKSWKDLKADSDCVVLENCYGITNDFLVQRVPGLDIQYESPREALAGVSNGSYQYFIWGEEPLRRKIKELGLDNLVLYEVEMPEMETHVIGRDQQLIEDIDNQYTRLEQSGDIEELYNLWFHPEKVKNRLSPYAIMGLLIALLAVIVVVYLLNRLTWIRTRRSTAESENLKNIMQEALKMGNYFVVQFDVRNDHLTNVQGKLLPEEGLTLEEFIKQLAPEEQEAFRKSTSELLQGKNTSHPLRLLWNRGTDEHPDWRHMRGNAIVERDEDGRPRYTVNAVKDMTDEVVHRYADDRLAQHFHMMFESSLVAMSFYDKDGMLIDSNKKMRELCGINEGNMEFFSESNMFDIPLLASDYSRNNRETFHVCQHMLYPEINIDKYIEFRVRPIFDDNDALIHYTVTARDLTDERTMYLHQVENEHSLQKTNKDIERYESQLRYLLEKSDTYVWTFDLATRDIRFSRSLSNIEYSQNRQDYIQWMVEDEREDAERNLRETMMNGKNFHAIHHFTHTPFTPHPCWFALIGIPTFNEKGAMTGYFGIARNVTELMEIQEKLKQETTRADESGKLKSVFLANMTHEIRTPLNAIVGFADVLQMVDQPEERREFIRIIRNNCDMLLRLINDIIEASNMNQGPLSIELADVDFAQVFTDICQTLAQRVQEPGVEFIVDNPYSSFRTRLDKGRMQQVITNFTTNAVKYTRQGHIKVGYRYENGGIYMYCEDTGAGIPKEKQASVFERFVKLNDYVQGTGLGLSICKSIADRCNGKIGVESEGEGHGSTFWIWIPCERME